MKTTMTIQGKTFAFDQQEMQGLLDACKYALSGEPRKPSKSFGTIRFTAAGSQASQHAPRVILTDC